MMKHREHIAWITLTAALVIGGCASDDSPATSVGQGTEAVTGEQIENTLPQAETGTGQETEDTTGEQTENTLPQAETGTGQETEAGYIISGLTQVSNNLGKDCLLTRGGYERMGTLRSECYSINLEDGTDIDKFNEEIADKMGDSVIQFANIQASISGAAVIYTSLMAIIVAGIIILSLIVVIFVMYLLVRTMLNNKKREYGIMKSIGYTTGQLVLQTAASFMPVVIISSITGIVISSIFINPLVALFLNGIGIIKCTFRVSALFNIAAGTGLVTFTFLAVCLMSLKIRKNTPRTLMSGE